MTTSNNLEGTGTRGSFNITALPAALWQKRIFLWLLPLAFLAVFFFIPLSRIFSLTLSPDTFTVENLYTAQSTILFTFYQAAFSTLLTLLLGLPSAYLFTRYEFYGKSILRALIAVPFMLPTVVVAASFNALLGQRGLISTILSFLLPDPVIGVQSSSFILQPFAVILLAHIFYNTTIVIRIVGTALSTLDPKLEQTARSLGAYSIRMWMNVTLPLLRPAILAATLLVFLFDFTSFGVILLLGGSQFSTLETEIYFQAVRLFNLPLAALLSIIQLICTLVVSLLYTKFASRTTPLAPRPALNLKPASLKQKLFISAFCLLLGAFFVLPLSSLPIRSFLRLEGDRGQRADVKYGFTTDYYEELFVNRRGSVFYVPPIQAVFNSLAYASAVVILSLAIGFPAAIALARPGRLEKILDSFIMLPLGSSAVMLGLGFIIAYGRWLASPLFVPFAHTLVALPFVIRTLQPAIASIPQRLRQAASTLGASSFEVWRKIDFPILRRAALAAATFAFTISLGEFGATLIIVRPEYPTVPIAIERFLSQPGGLNYGQAMAMASILMVMTVAGILLIDKFRLPNAGDF